MRRLRNDPSPWMNLTDIDLIDAESQRRWSWSLADRRDKRYFVAADHDNDFLGVVRVDEMDRTNRSIRVGCDIVPEQWGQGHRTRAFGCILKYWFDFLNMHRVRYTLRSRAVSYPMNLGHTLWSGTKHSFVGTLLSGKWC